MNENERLLNEQATMPNFYQILGLPFNASASDVKRAYREKAKACHPDISKSREAKKEFQLLNRAYSILSNAEKRRKYDLLLLYRHSLLREHIKKHRENARRNRRQKEGEKGWENASNMTSSTPSYRYYRADPPPLFKFGIYSTGILFGIGLFLSTIFSLMVNGWPWISSLILVPAVIVTYQGWNGMLEHRSEAGRHFLRGWGRFLNCFTHLKKADQKHSHGSTP